MRAIEIHLIFFFFMLIIIVTSSTTKAQKSPPHHHHHQTNHDELSIAIEEMEKASYFSFVMLINMVQQSQNSTFLFANITFLMPKDKTLTRSNIIQQDSVLEFLLRHSIPSPLPFDHLSLIPNGSIVPSSLPHYTLAITNGGRLHYFLNNVKIVSRNICNLGSIKCHGIDGILQYPSTIDDDDSDKNNHTSPFISCPNSHNNSEHDNSSRPDHTLTAPPPVDSPTRLGRSDSSSIRNRERDMSTLIAVLTVGLSLGVIGM